MARQLLQCGHEVRLASHDRGYENLRDEFNVPEIEGLMIYSTDNRVSTLATIGENLKRLPAGTRALKRLRDLFRQLRAHAVVRDFEPLTAYPAEQELNAWQVQQSGYGLASANPTIDTPGHFLYHHLPNLRRQSCDYPRDDDTGIRDKLAELVANDAALARQYRINRS